MLLFGGIGTPEIILIILAIFVLFGATKIPEFARSLGKGINEFRKAKEEIVNFDSEEDAHKSKPKQ